jgi:uncharacterized protein (TIGR03000 family)
VIVPPWAEVWINDGKTTQTGPVREFITPRLPPGQTYFYTVHARWKTDSGPYDEARDVRVRANRESVVDFSRSGAQTLRVPPWVP